MVSFIGVRGGEMLIDDEEHIGVAEMRDLRRKWSEWKECPLERTKLSFVARRKRDLQRRR